MKLKLKICIVVFSLLLLVFGLYLYFANAYPLEVNITPIPETRIFFKTSEPKIPDYLEDFETFIPIKNVTPGDY